MAYTIFYMHVLLKYKVLKPVGGDFAKGNRFSSYPRPAPWFYLSSFSQAQEMSLHSFACKTFTKEKEENYI